MSDSKSELIAEYNMLQDEIKTNSQVTAQIFTVTITAAGLLIGYGLQARSWIIFFSPFAILLPSLWFISSQLESTIRIATYIKIFIEPKINGLEWENRLCQLRKKVMIPEKKYTLSITGIYGAIGFGCLILAWVLIGDYSLSNVSILSVATIIVGCILIIVIINVRRCFGLGCYSNYCKAWEKLLEEK